MDAGAKRDRAGRRGKPRCAARDEEPAAGPTRAATAPRDRRHREEHRGTHRPARCRRGGTLQGSHESGLADRVRRVEPRHGLDGEPLDGGRRGHRGRRDVTVKASRLRRAVKITLLSLAAAWVVVVFWNSAKPLPPGMHTVSQAARLSESEVEYLGASPP